MSNISFQRYVNIISGVIGTNEVGQRSLSLRVFTENPLLPSNGRIEFVNPGAAAACAAYFGSGSVEAALANFYFGFISKTNRQTDKISFFNWTAVASAPLIFGITLPPLTLTALQQVGPQSFSFTMGGITLTQAGVDCTAAGSLAACAAIIQTAIRTAGSAHGALWTGATVVYDSTRGSFDFAGGANGACIIGPVPAGPLQSLLGWTETGVILSNGADPVTLTNLMTTSTSNWNGYGSFTFIPTLTSDQWVELATWNATQNNEYMMLVPVTVSTAAAISTALKNFPGIGMTLAPSPTTSFPHVLPGAILSATDYTARNVSQNFMYQQANLPVAVSNDTDANTYDALGVNYYGQTRANGTPIDFYQRGELTGLSNSPTDMNIYANEMWFKSAVTAQILNLLLQLNEIPVNNSGRATLISAIQSVIDQALFNGTISTGTTLNPTQIAAITEITGDPNAYFQVQSSGYWLNVGFTSSVGLDGDTEWAATYTLIYKKNDAIRSVQGTHDLV